MTHEEFEEAADKVLKYGPVSIAGVYISDLIYSAKAAIKTLEKIKETRDVNAEMILLDFPFQEIGQELELKIGNNVAKSILPEIKKLKAELERLKVAPVVVPPLNGEELAYDHWTLQDAFKDGYKLAASRARTIGPGEAEELRLLCEIGELTLAIRSAEDAGIPNSRAYVDANDRRYRLLDSLGALRTQATTSGEGEP